MILKSFGTVFLVAFALLSTLSDAEAKKRIALVIGNSSYQASPLKNPVNDANLIEKSLRKTGFEVIKLLDADLIAMRRAMLDFSRSLRSENAVGLFFYAGHGVQSKGENYLLPIGMDLQDENELGIEAVSVNRFLATLQDIPSAMKIVILDACRNNPFKRGFRSLDRGLARISAPSGTFVAYSTAPGNVATDGVGLNSPYSLALSHSLLSPGRKIEDVFKDVRRQVLEQTKASQTPWENSSLTDDFFFVPGAPNPPGGQGAAKPPVVVTTPSADNQDTAYELAYWDSVKGSEDADLLQSYIDAFPSGKFVPLAKILIERANGLQGGQQASASSGGAKPHFSSSMVEVELEQFITQRYLGGDLADASHLRAIYNSEVDFYGNRNMALEDVVADKLRYGRRWPEHHYELLASSLSIQALDDGYFQAFFNARFELANNDKSTKGVTAVQLGVFYENGRFRIHSENGQIISQDTIDRHSSQTRGSCPPKTGAWRVVSINARDHLNVRSGPGANYGKLGELAYNAAGFGVTGCRAGWCEVQYGCLKGFVSGKYVTRLSDLSDGAFHVTGHMPHEELNVRRGRGTNYGILYTIPYDADGIRVGECRKRSSQQFHWCYVTYSGRSGWAYDKYLADKLGRRPSQVR